MQKFVFIIKEDVCARNNCSEKVNDLLNVMTKYGEVHDLDQYEDTLKNEYQATIDNLTTQLDTLKAHNLTPEEIKVLNVMREGEIAKNKKREEEFAQEKSQLIADKQATENKLTQVKQEFSNYKRRIINIVGTDTEVQ